MALKFQIDSLDQVAEPLRANYVAKDGKFVLDVEGAVPVAEREEVAARLTEFRDNNRTLNTTVTDLQAKLKAFEGIDPAKYKEMDGTIKKLKDTGIKAADDVSTLIEKAVAAAVGPLQQQIEEFKTSDAKKTADLATEGFKSTLKDVAIKAGVDEAMLPHFIDYALKTYRYQDGKFVPMNGDAPLYSKKNPAKTLNPAEWVEQQAVEARGFFKPSGGGGAGDKRAPGVNAQGKRVISGADPLEFGQNLESIAKGETILSGN